MNNKIHTVVFILLVISSGYSLAFADEKNTDMINGVYKGMLQDEFAKTYPKKSARTYRRADRDEWITFNEPLDKNDQDMITFHLQDGKIMEWRRNDRAEVVREYLGEFCSQGIIHGMPKIHTALVNVLGAISLKDFLLVTDRQRPVLVTEYYYTGTARFASTAEIMVSDDDAPACQKGLTIIKLGDALNEADTSAPIEGVFAHELAHRVLEHARKDRVTCDDEREANRLIKQWGFSEQFTQASRMFGRKEGDPASCQETK